MTRYKTIAGTTVCEHIEKRSRFICLASPVNSEGEAATLLEEIRTRNWDANHNCYAYILRTGNIQRCSDDGEPQGTAGLPILEVLRHRGMQDVIVVVTRYFGGTLLGAGGLIRAYSQGAALALDSATTLDMHLCTVASLELHYSAYGKLQNLFAAFGVVVLEESFTENVGLRFRIEADKFYALQKEIAEMSAGSFRPVVLREEFAPIPI